MPYIVRMFFKFLFEECMKKFKSQEKAMAVVTEFLMSKWLLPACFKDTALHGLTKDFSLG